MLDAINVCRQRERPLPVRPHNRLQNEDPLEVRAGLVKGFGVSAREPVAALPEVPSLTQLGHKELELQHWHGIFAPAGTPRPIIDQLNAALRKAIADPRIRKAFADVSANEIAPEQQTPEALGALLHSEIKRWGDVIRRYGYG